MVPLLLCNEEEMLGYSMHIVVHHNLEVKQRLCDVVNGSLFSPKHCSSEGRKELIW